MSIFHRVIAVMAACLASTAIGYGQTTSISAGTQQQTTSTSTLDATASLGQSLLALTGGQTISDVVLTGTVIRTAGSAVETVPIKFEAKGFSESKVEFTSSAFVASEVFGLSGGIPACQWADAKGVVHQTPTHNCMVPVWFFPELSPLGTVGNTNTAVALVGSETYNGAAVDHYRITQTFGQPKPVGSALFLGDTIKSDLYCDQSTHLPALHSPTSFIPTKTHRSTFELRSGFPTTSL